MRAAGFSARSGEVLNPGEPRGQALTVPYLCDGAQIRHGTLISPEIALAAMSVRWCPPGSSISAKCRVGQVARAGQIVGPAGHREHPAAGGDESPPSFCAVPAWYTR